MKYTEKPRKTHIFLNLGLLQVLETCNHNLKQRQADSLQQKQLTQQRDNIQTLEQENRKIQHHVEKLDDAARQLSKELELENGKRVDFQSNSGILEVSTENRIKLSKNLEKSLQKKFEKSLKKS